GFGSTEFHVIRPQPGAVLAEWLWYFIRQVSYRQEGIRHFRGGVGQQRVPPEFLENTEIPVPPIDEQERIVARIRECLERVDQIESLRAGLEADHSALRHSTVSHVIEALKLRYTDISVGDLVNGDAGAMRSGPFGSAMKHGEFVENGNLVIGIANVQENYFDP